MRALVLACALGAAGAALYPSHEARAWWDRWGRWHPNVYRPYPAVVAPPPPGYYAPVYPRPYAHWIRPHYNRFGRFVPGHWA